MNRNMQSYYALQPSHDLRKLYSKKFARLAKLRKDSGWFNARERDGLIQQMKWIEIELASRDAQLALF